MDYGFVFSILAIGLVLYPLGLILCFLKGFRVGFKFGNGKAIDAVDESGWVGPSEVAFLDRKYKAVVPGKVKTGSSEI